MAKAKTPTTRMPNTEFINLRAWLFTKGLKIEKINTGVGLTTADRSRRQIAVQLAGELRSLPKKTERHNTL